jgi:oxygen-independent coproporphyrinogen-3 oxidase
MGTYVTKKEKLAMSMVYGLKLLRIDRKDFKRLHGMDMQQVYAKEIKQLEEWGLVKLTKEALQVTYPKGWYYIDNISKMFYTPTNYKKPQPQITNTHFLTYLKKKAAVN